MGLRGCYASDKARHGENKNRLAMTISHHRLSGKERGRANRRFIKLVGFACTGHASSIYDFDTATSKNSDDVLVGRWSVLVKRFHAIDAPPRRREIAIFDPQYRMEDQGGRLFVFSDCEDQKESPLPTKSKCFYQFLTTDPIPAPLAATVLFHQRHPARGFRNPRASNNRSRARQRPVPNQRLPQAVYYDWGAVVSSI